MSKIAKSYVFSVTLLALMLVSFSANAREISGMWADPDQSGSGMMLLQEGEVLSGAWFFYDENSVDTWVTFVGVLVNDTMTTQLLRFTGPPVGNISDSPPVQSSVIGTVDLNIRSRGVIDFNYSITSQGDGLISGAFRLVPFSLTVSDTDLLADFAGFYTGLFSSGIFIRGIFSGHVDNFGTIRGVIRFTFSGSPCSVSGTVTAHGDVALTVSCGPDSIGSVGTGTVSPNGDLSGTWVSDSGLERGTFSGSRVE